MPIIKNAKSKKEVKEVKAVSREVGVEAPRTEREVLVFRDRFEAFRHFGVGSMEQLAEALGKSYNGESLEELLNG
jgi:hypothetical protein